MATYRLNSQIGGHGKYATKKVSEVVEIDPGYLLWMHYEKKLNVKMSDEVLELLKAKTREHNTP